jgi:hypothetical protein
VRFRLPRKSSKSFSPSKTSVCAAVKQAFLPVSFLFPLIRYVVMLSTAKHLN